VAVTDDGAGARTQRPLPLTARMKARQLSIINRMLAAPELPALARTKILEYVEEKAAGLYGDSRSQRRKFTARLSIKKCRYAGKLNPLQLAQRDVRAARGRGSSQKGPIGTRS